MNRFGDKGGRRTIGSREIALHAWHDKKAAELEAIRKNSVRLIVNRKEMGDMAHHAPDGHISMRKDQETEFFQLQRKGETNGQTVARLLRDGTWRVGPPVRGR